jgi:hypothetical protein
MNAARLLTAWRKECSRAPALVNLAAGKDDRGNFKSKGLRFDERALERIGGAIEKLADAPDYRAALTQLCFVVRTGDKAARLKACEGAEALIAKTGELHG